MRNIITPLFAKREETQGNKIRNITAASFVKREETRTLHHLRPQSGRHSQEV